MPELKASIRTPRFRWVLAGFGGGAGVTIAIAAIQAVKYRPEFLPQLLNGSFLFFATLIIGIFVVDRKTNRFLAVQERTVIAQEQLAANVGALVAKDDQKVREQELMLNHLAQQSNTILEEVRRIKAGPTG